MQSTLIDHMGLGSRTCWTQITTTDLEKALVADDCRLKLNFDDFGMTSAPGGDLYFKFIMNERSWATSE